MNNKIKVTQRHGDSFKDKLYLPAIYDGVKVTFKHLFKNVSDSNAIDTLEYPEEQPTDITERYRGLHRLTHRTDGSVACVACFMCATACPSNCIFIEATEREDGHDEKMPKKFFIKALGRCKANMVDFEFPKCFSDIFFSYFIHNQTYIDGSGKNSQVRKIAFEFVEKINTVFSSAVADNAVVVALSFCRL